VELAEIVKFTGDVLYTLTLTSVSRNGTQPPSTMCGTPSRNDHDLRTPSDCGINTVIVSSLPNHLSGEDVWKTFSSQDKFVTVLELFKWEGEACARLVFDRNSSEHVLKELPVDSLKTNIGVTVRACKGQENCPLCVRKLKRTSYRIDTTFRFSRKT